MMPRCVYRCWGNSETLYIGSSSRPARRLQQHLFNGTWGSQIADVIEVWYSNQEDAYGEERRAIATEQPRHNRFIPIHYPPNQAAPIGQWNPKYLNAPGMGGYLARALHEQGVSFYRAHRAMALCMDTAHLRFTNATSFDVNELAAVAGLLHAEPAELLVAGLAA